MLHGDAVADLPATPSFDSIIAAAAAVSLPAELLAMLRVGGRLVIPVGRSRQEERLLVAHRTESGVEVCSLGSAGFVPLTGRHRSGSREHVTAEVPHLCYGRPLSIGS